MKVCGMLTSDLEMAPLAIAEIEARGYDCAFSAEINNDPFFPLLLAAEHSKSIDLTTSISVAFARNPMTMANLAWDLNQYSQGRFTLGLGSQIEAHITRRFSMPWSKPAARMREFILAVRTIWGSWETGEKLDFRGKFYQHTLMTPMFVPAKKDFGAPQIRLAGVGPRMTEVAGEVADGLIAHGFTTARYLEQVTIPAVEAGLRKAGKLRNDFDISSPIIVVSGADKNAFEQSKQAVKAQLAFYGSTPAYRSVLDLHGWGDLQPVLNSLSKQGQWVEMGELITDEILDAFAIVTESPEQIPMMLKSRYGHLIDSWQCTYEAGNREAQQALIRTVQAG
jgi:probable F420-dependent oxidoreductase